MIALATTLKRRRVGWGPPQRSANVSTKFVKKVDPEQAKEINQKIAKNYHMYSSWYKEEH